MLSKLYEKFKKFLRDNYLYLIILVSTYFILTFPIPYVVEAPGGIIDITKKIDIDTKVDTEGSYNLAYVTEYQGTVFTALLSFVIPDWDLEKIEPNNVNENQEAIYLRDHLMLEEANQTAILYAYQKAGKKATITNEKMYVTYLDTAADWQLKVGDELLKAEGKTLQDKDDLSRIIQTKEVGDSISLVVKRDGKEKTLSAKVRREDGEKVLGIIISFLREVETDPEITLKFSKSESGPSAGFMTALTIYQALIDEDLTNGLKIVGTGTIDANGNIGSIGGVTYKLMGAEKANADVFFVPEGDNYQEAKKLKEERNYQIKLVKVKTFDDALQYLEKQNGIKK